MSSNNPLSLFSQARKIESIHDECNELWHIITTVCIPDPTQEIIYPVCQNHFHNFTIWHEEDLVRKLGISDYTVASCKRLIDIANQKRNDYIELIDEIILKNYPSPKDFYTPINSETPGSIIDRLSVLSLKEYHLKELVSANNDDTMYLNRLTIISKQRKEIYQRLLDFCYQIENGDRTFQLFKQLKMYGDIKHELK